MKTAIAEKTPASTSAKFATGAEVNARYRISACTRWRWIKDGLFPAPTRLPSGALRWENAVLDAWDARGEPTAEQQAS